MVSQAPRAIRAGQSIGTTLTIQNDGDVPTGYVVEVVGLNPLGIPGAVGRVPVPVIAPGMTRSVPINLQIPATAVGGAWTVQARIYEAGPGGALGILVDEVTLPGVLEVEAPLTPPAPAPVAPPGPTLPPAATAPPTVQQVAQIAGGQRIMLAVSQAERLANLDPTGQIAASLPTRDSLLEFINSGRIRVGAATLSPEEYLTLQILDPFNRVRFDLSPQQLLEFVQTGVLPDIPGAPPTPVMFQPLPFPSLPPPPLAGMPQPPPPPMPITGPAPDGLLEAEQAERAEMLAAAQAQAAALREQAEAQVADAMAQVNALQGDFAAVAGQIDFLNVRVMDLAEAIDEYNSLGFFQIVPVWWSERFGLRRPSIDDITNLFDGLREEQAGLRQQRSDIQAQITQAQQELVTDQAALRRLG
ncbi:MAG: hypothetical protein Q8R28_10370 [Dehalococcoidia bacterium]|nr:hypothetical protein [Dehalococcoidia bacterium]